MVDNENNQWEDELEYTEDKVSEEEETETYTEDDAYPDEETVGDDVDEYQDTEEYEEEEEAGEEPPKKKSALPLIVLLLVLLLAGAIVGVPKLMNKDGDSVANNNSQQQDMNNQSNEDLAGSFFDAAGGEDTEMMSVDFNENGEGMNFDNGEEQNFDQNQDQNFEQNPDQNFEQNQEQQAPTVTEARPGEGIVESDLFADQNSQENDSIMVVYNRAARINPFKPPVITSTASDIPYETINNTQFEIIEPPTASIPDENLTKLLQTQISGIMYDSQSPAAIVNINGVDQFVKTGDVISGYKIEKITKDKVQISYKNNSYVASVGELFTKGYLEQQQAVANLENKFAGRNKNKN